MPGTSDDWAGESETVNTQVMYEVVGHFIYRLLLNLLFGVEVI